MACQVIERSFRFEKDQKKESKRELEWMKSVIVSAARTPFGKLGGQLSSLSAVQLGGIVMEEALHRAQWDPMHLDQVLMGMVLQGGAGQIPARQAARHAGVPWEVPADTVNKVCASGLRSVTMADQIIRSGDAKIILAGGMESMSQAPYASKGMRWGERMGNSQFIDLMVHDGLTCPFQDVHMAIYGSQAAERMEISREEQDEWALRSHQRAIAAMKAGRLADELVEVKVSQKKGAVMLVGQDEGPREDTSIEKLSALQPLFLREGTVTAGNAPGVNDGAGAMLLMEEQFAKETDHTPLAIIHGHAQVGTEAANLAMTPGLAIQKLLAQTGMELAQIHLFEVNEAFASVVLTTQRIIDWDPERVNVNGGAIAFGHPIGASGTRILMTLIYELRRRGGGYGIAAICSGAAQGDAILVEVPAD